ncbi:glycine N-acyltransferase-like protein 3 [Hemicordylus capensis]|uniref:glycine N-acyltransferase-like protein 3 n=1 Tax=Hemicordylus capensis TaxID=884348 RepID=UPI002302325F|nr:glycine N-acyltransferase-like protein 3 [Hemicordylus capensis]XP_053140208.1 glycine N-acyltransferase-like protein 3 [Hemicordylus capensis]
MLILSCSSKLQLLEGILRKNLPRTLPVHGAVMNINRGNPAGHEVIVDSWPEFKAVLTRPRREVASDDLNMHVNIYAAFYRDFDVYRTLLQDTDAVNWAQNLYIFGNQDGILEASREAAAVKQVQFSADSCITCCMYHDPNKYPEYRLDPGFTLSSLNSSHVDLLNETWHYGGNEQSHRYLASLVRHFPNACILDVNGLPISWNLMDPFGAMVHGYTLPSYRRKGYLTVVTKELAIQAHAASYPVYGHVALDNNRMQNVLEKMRYQRLPELCHFCLHFVKEENIKDFPWASKQAPI